MIFDYELSVVGLMLNVWPLIFSFWKVSLSDVSE